MKNLEKLYKAEHRANLKLQKQVAHDEWYRNKVWERTLEATLLWRKGSPRKRDLTLPDLGDLLLWLMLRGDEAHRRKRTAQQQTAELHDVFRAYRADVMHFCAELARMTTIMDTATKNYLNRDRVIDLMLRVKAKLDAHVKRAGPGKAGKHGLRNSVRHHHPRADQRG